LDDEVIAIDQRQGAKAVLMNDFMKTFVEFMKGKVPTKGHDDMTQVIEQTNELSLDASGPSNLPQTRLPSCPFTQGPFHQTTVPFSPNQLPGPQHQCLESKGVNRLFSSWGMTNAELFKMLRDKNALRSRQIHSSPPPPSKYNPKARCEFHEGAKGYTIENCRMFEKEVWKMIDRKEIDMSQIAVEFFQNLLKLSIKAGDHKLSSRKERNGLAED